MIDSSPRAGAVQRVDADARDGDALIGAPSRPSPYVPSLNAHQRRKWTGRKV